MSQPVIRSAGAASAHAAATYRIPAPAVRRVATAANRAGLFQTAESGQSRVAMETARLTREMMRREDAPVFRARAIERQIDQAMAALRDGHRAVAWKLYAGIMLGGQHPKSEDLEEKIGAFSREFFVQQECLEKSTIEHTQLLSRESVVVPG